jgi:peptidoglycan lytic transglycosylase B
VTARYAVLHCLLLALCASAADATEDYRGWGYLVDKLIRDGVDPARVVAVFEDPRMEPFDGLEFGLAPREPHSIYAGFLRAPSITAARRCRATHAVALSAAAGAYGVPANLVAAILHIETGCGQRTGSSLILYRLARLAMANEPANLRVNMARLAEGDPVIEERVRARARYLEDTFFPEVRAAFDLADRLRVDPLTLRGSSSGALGDPQFLPTNYLRYGTDADGDGRIDLFDIADAAASCARYLAAEGWHAGMSEAERRAVIWRYNRSEAYVDTVLSLAHRLDGPDDSLATRAQTKKTVRAPAHATAVRRPPAHRAQSGASGKPARSNRKPSAARGGRSPAVS